MSDTAGRRAAAAATVLVIAWVATYWLWEPREGHSAEVVFDEPPVVEPTQSPSDPTPRIADPLNRPEPQTDADADPPDEADATTSPRLVPPEFRQYTIRSGDSLQSIAQSLYGRASYWQAIAKSNPELDPMRLRAGRTIRVPKDPENFQGRVTEAPPGAPPAAPDAPEVIEHIVQPNDSLWKIAASFYSDGTKWTIIRDANRALVGDEGEKLRAGMTLRIPPAPRPAR